MHVEEWHDPSQNAAWQRQDHRPGPWPFKPGGSPFFLYPGGSNPTRAIIDIAHTFHIKGVGCDFVASALALCARKGLFGQGTFDYKLQVAYYIYMQYCTATKKTTSIRQWSNIGDLGMTTYTKRLSNHCVWKGVWHWYCVWISRSISCRAGLRLSLSPFWPKQVDPESCMFRFHGYNN